VNYIEIWTKCQRFNIRTKSEKTLGFRMNPNLPKQKNRPKICFETVPFNLNERLLIPTAS
jgi:hypothetical protein